MKAFLAENLGKKQNKINAGRVLCLISLMLITVFVFYPVLTAGFINYDDQVMVSGNLKITSLANVKAIFFDSHLRLYHPLVNLSFAVEYMLFGYDPYIYHAVNLILHLLNILLVFFIFFKITRRDFLIAFITAAIFACHPLNVEPVAWISSRKDVLYAFFFLSSLLFYLKAYFAQEVTKRVYLKNSNCVTLRDEVSEGSAVKQDTGEMQMFRLRNSVAPLNMTDLKTRFLERRKVYYALSLIFFICACLSKPMAVTLPAVLILIDWFKISSQTSCAEPLSCHPARSRRVYKFIDSATSRRMTTDTVHTCCTNVYFKSCLKYVPYFAAAFLFAAVTYLLYYDAGEKNAMNAALLFKNFISAHFNAVFYLAKFIVPSKLAIIYPDFAKGAKHLPLFIWLSPVFIWSLFALAAFSLKYTKKIFFGSLFFAITVLPVINILPAGPVPVADRYVYIPCIGFAFIAASVIAFIYAKLNLQLRFRFLKIVFASALCAVFGAMCFAANAHVKKWDNSLSVFNNQIKNYPGSSAMAYVLRYCETRNIRDLYDSYRINSLLSTTIFSMGCELQKEKKYEEALNFYKRMHKDDLNRAAAYINAMEIYRELGEEDKFFQTFKESVDILPKERTLLVYMYLAAYHYEKEEYEKAFNNAEIAKQIFSKVPDNYLLKASIYEKQNNFDGAFKEYEEALLNCGADSVILESLGALYFKTGNYAAAERIFERAVKINPSSFTAYNYLGNIAALNNLYKKALEKYTMALLVKNDFGQAYFHRAVLYMKYKQYDKAELEADKAKNSGFEVPQSFYEDLKFLKANENE